MTFQNFITWFALSFYALAGGAFGDDLSLSPTMVIDSPRFPVPTSPYHSKLRTRDSGTFQCDWSLGLAYLNATTVNIDHLRDVKDIMCKSSPNSCTRVAFEDFSGLFFCNDNDAPIMTKCGNLIDPATTLSRNCQLQGYYTYGVLIGTIVNGTDPKEGNEVPYHLRIAAEGWDHW